MLTRTSSPISRVKMLLFIPVAAVCLICCSKNNISQKIERNGNIATYRGNKFELSSIKYDTIMTTDPVSGKEEMVCIQTDPYPIKMNGKKIYDVDELDHPQMDASTAKTTKPSLDDKGVVAYLTANMKDELKDLPDGQYYLIAQYVVLDEHGKIVYYENGGISTHNVTGMQPPAIPKALQERVTKKINNLLADAPSYSPAILNGYPVPCVIYGSSFTNLFTIKDHKLVGK